MSPSGTLQSPVVAGKLRADRGLDYLRFQSGHHPQPAAATINRRVGVVERALRNEFPDTAASPFAPGFHHFYWRRPPLGYGRPRPALSRLRVKEPKRILMPLSVDEVALAAVSAETLLLFTSLAHDQFFDEHIGPMVERFAPNSGRSSGFPVCVILMHMKLPFSSPAHDTTFLPTCCV